MAVRITCYGGVAEIGGNKFLLEDKDTKVLLDFGTGFSEGSEYFNGMIKPRGVNGAGDLFEFGLLPEIQGLYSEEALQNTELKHKEPDVAAVILSHYHWDHMGRIPHIDREIPVYCGETTELIAEAYSRAGGSPLDGHKLKTFRTGDRFRVGPMEFVPVHVDHSIPGAYGFVIHTSEGAVAYTGDFRFHGRAGSMTGDFVKAAKEAEPQVLLSEGTRVNEDDTKRAMSEEDVLNETLNVVGSSRRLVLSSFKGNDVDRINTFSEAAEKTGRRLLVSMKTALLLEMLSRDSGIEVPKVGKDVLVYVKRKRSGKIDDKDYLKWERPFLNHGSTAEDVHREQGKLFLHLETWNLPEVIDIKPERGGVYVHSSTEAFNEEGEREEDLVKNWVDHLGFSYHQIHASGHAPMTGVKELVVEIGARKVVPIHTEHPEMFRGFRGGRVELPVLGKPLAVSGN
ncbi:MAG: MBL fold metallo-hydrolase [Nitrososphaerales archaeon]|nr:MBL fold metallo-hydrolase [Nitrososphaerales archaeon]